MSVISRSELKAYGRKACTDCEAFRKSGGAGLCTKCTQEVIDKNPELQKLQKKGKAVIESFSKTGRLDNSEGLKLGTEKYGTPEKS